MNMMTPLPIPAASAAINAASLRALRRQVEDRVEHLIALLDSLDADPDLEPDTDGEPWLAGYYGPADGGADYEKDDSEREPSLGWPNGHQGKGAPRVGVGDYSDDEAEDTALENAGRGFIRSGGDDAEEGGDAERSLGASSPDWWGIGGVSTATGFVRFDHGGMDQRLWASGGSDDDREEGDDNGIADGGGVQDQFGGVGSIASCE